MIPPRSVLAATDFSDPARSALGFAARLARHCRASFHVVHAEHPLLSAAAAQNGVSLAEQTREELQRIVTATPPAADCSPELHAVSGPAVDVILDVARAQHADLIVVGGHGMSGAEKLVFGSTTEGLLRRSDVSVLVVPAEWTPPRPAAVDLAGIGPLIAAVDLTDASGAGARAACGLAAALGTSVEMVHVVPQLPVLTRWQSHAERVMSDHAAAARTALERFVLSLGCQPPHGWRVETGPVPQSLAMVAGKAADRAPLLVLGRKAAGSRGAAPGTIAYRVLLLAKVPVLMVVSLPASSD